MSRRANPAALLLAVSMTLVAAACGFGRVEPPPAGLAIVPVAEVPADGATYSATHHAYVSDSAAAGLIALSARDPNNGCRLAHIAPGDDSFGLDPVPGTRFIDPCHGSQYDLAGNYLAGPSETDMTRIEIEVYAEIVYIDATGGS